MGTLTSEHFDTSFRRRGARQFENTHGWIVVGQPHFPQCLDI